MPPATTSSPAVPRPDLREHLAAERTLLAYQRTALSMMGFGFVVARFGLFLREAQQHVSVRSYSLSVWFGTGLVLLGSLLTLLAVRDYTQLVTKLNATLPAPWPASRLAMGTSLVLGLIGLAMAGYLMVMR